MPVAAGTVDIILRPLLALCMIVKDEASNIVRTLESCADVVDSFCILDTGSTDGTKDIIRDWKSTGRCADLDSTISGDSKKQGVSMLQSGPFVDFANARNRACAFAVDSSDSPIFALSLSGDETLFGGDALRAFLEERKETPDGVVNGASLDGAYCIEMRSGTSRWFYPRILRIGAGWKYKGAVHEVPIGPNEETKGPIVPGCYIVHTASDPDRRAARVRDLDIPILEKIVLNEEYSLEERANSIWFLAQSHETVADVFYKKEPGSAWVSHKMMAMSLYRRRAEIEGNLALNHGDDIAQVEDKATYSLFRYYNIAEQLNLYTSDELLTRLEVLAELNPRLPEVRYMIAVHASQTDARKGLFLAELAARVASEAKNSLSHLPVDNRIEWLSFRIAAACAKTLNKPIDYIKRLAEKGLAAGGPMEAFAEYGDGTDFN